MTKDKFAFLPVGRETGTMSFLAVFDPLHWLCKRHENFTSCYYWYSVLEVKSDEKENARKQRKWSNETNHCNRIRLWSFGLSTPIKVYNFSHHTLTLYYFAYFRSKRSFSSVKKVIRANLCTSAMIGLTRNILAFVRWKSFTIKV